jgi:integrase
MQKVHLTKTNIEAFTYEGKHPKAHDIRWDEDYRGFGVRVFPSGEKTFVFRYSTKHGRRRLITVAKVGELPLNKAREKVTTLRADVLNGADPADDRAAARKSHTFNALADRYLKEHAEKKKKASSARDDRRNLKRHIRPRLGSKPLPSITRSDIQALHQSLSDKPYAANRVLALLSKMFNLAEKWGLIPDGQNPCRHVERFRETPRERFLSKEELSRLAGVLNQLEESEAENEDTLLAIRLLVFTGARLNEILKLRWAEVYLDDSQLRLEDSKTGKKTIFLPPQALELLRSHPRDLNNPFVVRGQKDKSHLVNLEKPWQRVRKLAGLEGVRLHDLRHTFASVALAGGLSLPTIGVLLGHRNAATTQRYAHLANDSALQAAQATGLAISNSFSKA